MRKLRGLFCAIAFCAAGPLLAQDTAVLMGTVTDPAHAVVVGAKVLAVNVATNFETQGETNSEGIYRLPFMRPGTYRVVITAEGFKRFQRDNIELRVGATLPIDAMMEVGAVAESVQVSAAAPLLETETSTTGTIVD